MLGLTEAKLSPKTAWLQSYLGLSPESVAGVMKAFPPVLILSIENLEGKVRSWPCLEDGGCNGCCMQR